MSGALSSTLRHIMQRGAGAHLSEADFNSLALQVFAHQFAHNAPYRRFCERRQSTPESISHWHEIPAVPTAAFKEVSFAAGQLKDAQAVFRTSGTTRGRERRGTHYILDLDLYYASLLPAFQQFVMGDLSSMRMFSLIPHWRDAPESSLSCMVSRVMDVFGAETSDYYVDPQSGIDHARLNEDLDSATERVCLLGTSLAYLHWLDGKSHNIQLPAGSRLMDTGGFKGIDRAVTADEMRARYATQLGLSDDMCINEYGMTELCSQYYGVHLKRGPSWLKFRVVDPDTLAPLPHGETGILQHFDLANLNSVSAVLTEDLAYESADGFVLIGRAPGAMPRGCSIAMDILLSDVEP